MSEVLGAELRTFLERRTGFSIPDDRWEFLAPRFLDRLAQRGFDSVADYVRYLESNPLGPAELDELFNALTVRKTSFFRNPACFKALQEEVLPRLLANRETHRPVSIWSAGCATGEEAYSLAMSARHVLGDDVPYYVLGTDIASDALTKARKGSYPAKSADSIPNEFQRYLTIVGGRTWIREEIRAAIEFASHNLATEEAPQSASGRWDVISCRNVLIYFGLEQAREVIDRFIAALAPGGALFLGHAEVFTDLEPELEVVFHGRTFYYRRASEPQPEAPSATVAPYRQSDTRSARRPGDPSTRPATSRRITPRATHSPATRESRPAGSRTDAPTERWSNRRQQGDTPTRAGTRRILPEDRAGVFRSEETRAEAERLGDGRPYESLLEASGHRQRGDLEGAVQTLRSAIQRAPRWSRSRVQLAEVYRELGQIEQAVRQLEAAVEVEPLEPRAHYLLGVIRAESDGFERAEVAFRRALYLEPDYVWARYGLACTYRATGREQRARRELRNVLRTLRTVELSRHMAGNPAEASLAELARLCDSDLAELGGE